MPTRDPQELTKKQRFWLSHLRACEESGQSKVSYAAAHGLKPKYLYNWKTRLIQVGILPDALATSVGKPSRTPNPIRKPQRAKTAGLSFTAVRVAGVTETGIRIHFPNGILLEIGASTESIPSQQLLSLLAALP